MFEGVEKIKVSSALGVLMFLGTLSLGFAYIYYFNKPLFLSLDTFKLSLLALSVVFPLTVFNMMFIVVLLRIYDEDGYLRAIIGGAGMSIVLLSMVFVLAIAFSNSIKLSIAWALGLELFFCLFLYLENNRQKKHWEAKKE